MGTQTLPNFWNTCNLHESPYFQGALGADGSNRPLSLFVGRAQEQQALIRVIQGAGRGSSRQAVGGMAGVGKTTLIQAVKGQLLEIGYWTTDGLVPLYPGDTAPLLLGRILAAIYDTILSLRPATQSHPQMLAAQQLVRAVRLSGGSASFSLGGVGLGGSTSQSAVNPPDALLLEGPRLIHDLLALVRDTGAPGLVLHLNNLENLSEDEASDAGDVLRSLRDTVLLQDGLHLIVVGTTEAVLTVTQAHTQVRSVFTSPLLLAPLTNEEVEALLVARYAHLRVDPATPVTWPVAGVAVRALYPLFRGDLRGLLKALEEGATQLIGVAPAPLELPLLSTVLKDRYARQLPSTLEASRLRQLQAWGNGNAEQAQTQASLGTLWKISQPAVSNALSALMQAGYVVALPRQGAEPISYVLTGASRIIFGVPTA